MNSSIYRREVPGWTTVGQTTASKRGLLPWLMGTTVVMAGLIWLYGYQVGHSPVAGLTSSSRSLRATISADGRQLSGLKQRIQGLVRAANGCSNYSDDIGQITRFIARGDDQAAADLAYSDVSGTPNPCAGTKTALAGFWYTASMSALFSASSTNPADNTPVLVWNGIRRKARDLSLLPAQELSPLTVFYRSRQSEPQLALYAFTMAWTNGVVDQADLTQIDDYQAVLDVVGVSLAAQVQSGVKAQGLVDLATDYAIGEAYGTSTSAGNDLDRIIGPTGWPAPDWKNPVLAATRQ